MRITTYVSVLLLPVLIVGCGNNRAAYKIPPVEPALVETPQNDRGMYLDLIKQMQTQGAYFASLAHIDAFRQRFGDIPELRILQADALRETGERSAATQQYRTLTKGPQAAQAWHGLGLIAAASNDAAGAQLALQNAVQIDPLNVAYLGDLGFALLQSGDVGKARAPLAKAAELAPGNARAVSNLALWALLDGRPEMAEAMIQRANLPQATRQEILRLASALRRPMAMGGEANNVPAALAAQQGSQAPALQPLPPRSMLDRFTPTTAQPQETVQ
ncbi:Flp pilus assembly protein TadD [Stenotrophomonas sp. Iso1]|uniref:Flp pilus assembly protein TadD n=1 Tax=Stenotrophomonas sp. Iso1 TaxID=2977283 RepID=UPI0022B77374|nr:Flp pilus assembly protein TadD [Stenotrophomonas sp. Iso1]